MKLKFLDYPLEKQKEQLHSLLVALKRASSVYEKIDILNSLHEVDTFFSFSSPLKTFLSGLSPECEYVIKGVFAIGQGSRIFDGVNGKNISALRPLLEELLALENFYKDLGGVIGYQHLVLTLLTTKNLDKSSELFTPPPAIDLQQEKLFIRSAIIEGIKNQGTMGELYPVGGAADRLELRDEKTAEGLPAARLIFLGKSLLEGVVRDLQAREYLHYKLFGRQVTTPIGMMTSQTNRNGEHIRSLCEKNQWFGRPPSSFLLFTQPSVPTFTKRGEWCLQRPLKLLSKPGGHGMLWKLLQQNKAFDWFAALGVSKVLVRQINNPVAATDCGLLAFLGLGHRHNKAFGFASCPRVVHAQEGMNVIKELNGKRVITNIEYCDFKKYGIKDEPAEQGGEYSLFPSNTNILFADLSAIQRALEKLPYPGLLLNFRKEKHHNSLGGEEIARLETAMQNIADAFAVEEEKPLSTYLTFYERRKTISTTKKQGKGGGNTLETPEGCYYDYMVNGAELLKKHCRMDLPPFCDKQAFGTKKPPFLLRYHPALGPLYTIIGQKVRGGALCEGSELQLEIADLELDHLTLAGSLLIEATDPIGHREEGALRYSNQTGRCYLKNVSVTNEGVDWKQSGLLWGDAISRKEALHIILRGHAEFYAADVALNGGMTLEVPSGMRMRAEERGGRVAFVTEPLGEASPFWHYSVGPGAEVELSYPQCRR